MSKVPPGWGAPKLKLRSKPPGIGSQPTHTKYLTNSRVRQATTNPWFTAGNSNFERALTGLAPALCLLASGDLELRANPLEVLPNAERVTMGTAKWGKSHGELPITTDGCCHSWDHDELPRPDFVGCHKLLK